MLPRGRAFQGWVDHDSQLYVGSDQNKKLETGNIFHGPWFPVVVPSRIPQLMIVLSFDCGADEAVKVKEDRADVHLFGSLMQSA